MQLFPDSNRRYRPIRFPRGFDRQWTCLIVAFETIATFESTHRNRVLAAIRVRRHISDPEKWFHKFPSARFLFDLTQKTVRYPETASRQSLQFPPRKPAQIARKAHPFWSGRESRLAAGGFALHKRE
jgi:hypothetical protein